MQLENDVRKYSVISYSVEGNAQMCADHFAKFCELQEKGKEDEARASIKLKPRKNTKEPTE